MTTSNTTVNSLTPCSANPSQHGSVLPYTDTKPVGAAGFYAAINATFRFIERRFGIEGLRQYWTDLGNQYYGPVAERWRIGGLPVVAEYWKAFFAAEPGAQTAVTASDDEVTVEVITCPAIKYLRDHGREIVPSFCQHCHFVSAAIGERAWIDVRISGGNGSCIQRFANRGFYNEPQHLEDIANATP